MVGGNSLKIIHNLINMNNFIRPICDKDFYNGYFDLMYEFSEFKKDVTYEEFINYINNDNITILCMYDTETNKLIGAGTIFKLNKLHNNPVGQIEDVIITSTYRQIGLGKILIKQLSDIGIHKYKCYKITLNCLEKNIGFYEKCDFKNSGVQMRLHLS